MADTTSAQPQQQAMQPGFAPPTQGVSQFVVTMNVNEVLITLGQSRMAINPQTGLPGSGPGIEWLLTLSVNSGAAKLLAEVLSQAIAEYERRFGKIPHDPNAPVPEMRVTEPTRHG
jgi:hypothetical protein